MGDFQIDRFVQNPPVNTAKERFAGDLMFKEVVFVYAYTLARDALNSSTPTWATVPVPINASVQVGSYNSQQVDPSGPPNRIARLFTRTRYGFKWNDKVCWRGIWMKIESVEEKLSNSDGVFQYLEARAEFLKEDNSISGAASTFKGV